MPHESDLVGTTSDPPDIVLASASPWRRAMLSAAGVRCVATESSVDEQAVVGSGPIDTARLRALAKARDVARSHPSALVIGADQVVHLDGETIGKPACDDDWMRRLRAFRGRTHDLSTAVALVEPGRPDELFSVHTRVRFRADATDDELAAYVAHGEARGCAGGYMVEQRGVWLVEAVDGDWTNVVGLPVFELVTRLRARGYRLRPDGMGRRASSTEIL